MKNISNSSNMFQKKIIPIIIWVIVWLAAFDLGINIFFPYPSDIQKLPNRFQEYFDYGRSIEEKVKRKLSLIEQQNNDVTSGGWLDTNRFKRIPIEGAKKGKLITIYGMSHANCLAQAMIKIGTHQVRNITTGGAPPNWSYAAFQMDHTLVHSDVAILAVMTVGVADISSTSGMVVFFEHPYTYTFPLYEFNDNGLYAKMPPFHTRDGFISFFRDPIKLSQYTQWLSQNDKYYSSFLFEENITDHSVIFRALKRTYFNTFINSKAKNVYSTAKGFNNDSYEVKILKEILHDFTRISKQNNILPIVYIVNNQACNDDLYQILKPQIETDSIPYLSTHKLCPPSDPTAYGTDGHFTLEKDHELALAVFDIIEKTIQ